MSFLIKTDLQERNLGGVETKTVEEAHLWKGLELVRLPGGNPRIHLLGGI